jgi:hypothetical protein
MFNYHCSTWFCYFSDMFCLPHRLQDLFLINSGKSRSPSILTCNSTTCLLANACISLNLSSYLYLCLSAYHLQPSLWTWHSRNYPICRRSPWLYLLEWVVYCHWLWAHLVLHKFLFVIHYVFEWSLLAGGVLLMFGFLDNCCHLWTGKYLMAALMTNYNSKGSRLTSILL